MKSFFQFVFYVLLVFFLLSSIISMFDDRVNQLPNCDDNYVVINDNNDRLHQREWDFVSQSNSFCVSYNTIESTSLESGENRNEIEGILNRISENTIAHLKDQNSDMQDVDGHINDVYQFIIANKEAIGKSVKEKMFRFMSDLHEAIDNLFAIHIHRTPISLKAYCKVFIYIFPIVYTPTIIFHIGEGHNQAIAYFIVGFTEFILISLYNIQDHLEYPFDNKGLDDIKLESFKFDR